MSNGSLALTRRVGTMDVKPRSNKLRRLEKKRKLEAQAARWVREDPKAAATRDLLSHCLRLAASSLPREPNPLLRMIDEVQDGHLLTSDLHDAVKLFADINPASRWSGCPLTVDVESLGRLVFLCHRRTGLFRGHDPFIMCRPCWHSPLIAHSGCASRKAGGRAASTPAGNYTPWSVT